MRSIDPCGGRRGVRGILLLAILCCVVPGSAALADLVNGDFSTVTDPPTGWDLLGDATIGGGMATLGLNSPDMTSLEQVFTIPAGSASLSFEYSPSVTGGGDFSVWLFDLGTMDALVETADVDNDGFGDWFFAHQIGSGSVLNSPYVTETDIGGGWARVTMGLTSLNSLPIEAWIAFDLLGDVGGDGTVLVDNVSITPVPVPPAVVLFVLGMGTAGTMLRRRMGRTA